MAKKLFIQNEDGSFEEVSGLITGPQLKAIKKRTISEAINHYLETCTSAKCPKNISTETNFFKKFYSYLVDQNLKYIDEVDHAIMFKFKNSLHKTMKASSVSRRFCTIKNFFVMCEKWQFILENPTKEIKKTRIEKNPRKVWTEKQFKIVLTECDDFHKSFLLFSWHTGARPSEIKNLRWRDIDFNKKNIFFNCEKNANISRDFPLTDFLFDLLHLKSMECEWVFHLNKKQINTDCISHYLRKILKRSKIKDLCLYGIRHTFAHRLSGQNISPFYIQKLMGHTDLKTTMNYVNAEKNELIDLLNRCNR